MSPWTQACRHGRKPPLNESNVPSGLAKKIVFNTANSQHEELKIFTSSPPMHTVTLDKGASTHQLALSVCVCVCVCVCMAIVCVCGMGETRVCECGCRREN